jgi:putative nucleotidyltransferase with HDIG domain
MFHSPIVAAARSSQVKLSELVGAFSYALDLTEGQPAGHSVRCCWIGSQIGRVLGLSPAERSDLYYALLLKDLGCSSNAARICELYEADDLAFKHGYKTVGTSLAASIRFVLSRSATRSPWYERPAKLARILRDAPTLAQEMMVARCTRGADIARSLRFSDAVCDGIFHLDEHWDGSGKPNALAGESISLFARIALLAQVADVFHGHAGPGAALDEVRRRAGNWLDPALVRLFERLADRDFWTVLASPSIELHLTPFAPDESGNRVDDDYLDSIAEAFGQVIDAKSPFTAGHSRRVGELAADIAAVMGFDPDRQRWVRRAALLHDIGKLGVSNAILDKPAALDSAEWEIMRSHASHTREILHRIGALADIADVAAAHHERLDGRGYPLGLSNREIQRETRIITVCDYFDALTADRPYRSAMPLQDALGIIDGEVGASIDGESYEALRSLVI